MQSTIDLFFFRKINGETIDTLGLGDFLKSIIVLCAFAQ